MTRDKTKNKPSINEKYATILHGIDATTVQETVLWLQSTEATLQ